MVLEAIGEVATSRGGIWWANVQASQHASISKPKSFAKLRGFLFSLVRHNLC